MSETPVEVDPIPPTDNPPLETGESETVGATEAEKNPGDYESVLIQLVQEAKKKKQLGTVGDTAVALDGYNPFDIVDTTKRRAEQGN